MRAFMDWAAWYNCAPKGAIVKMVLPIPDIAKEGRTKAHTAATNINTDSLKLAQLEGLLHHQKHRLGCRRPRLQ